LTSVRHCGAYRRRSWSDTHFRSILTH
jgi:hypothetical protein